MADSQPSAPTPIVSPSPLRPPPRPPRLRPSSRSSSVVSDPNGSNQNTTSELWADVTLSTFPPEDKIPITTHREYLRGSFIDMHKGPTEAVSPVRELSSPTLGTGDTTPIDYLGLAKKTSERATSMTFSDRGSQRAKRRSTVRSVFLVLSCAGAMIINVGKHAFRGSASARAVVDYFPVFLDCKCYCCFYCPSNHRGGFGH